MIGSQLPQVTPSDLVSSSLAEDTDHFRVESCL
jgi:hypothetical protein